MATNISGDIQYPIRINNYFQVLAQQNTGTQQKQRQRSRVRPNNLHLTCTKKCLLGICFSDALVLFLLTKCLPKYHLKCIFYITAGNWCKYSTIKLLALKFTNVQLGIRCPILIEHPQDFDRQFKFWRSINSKNYCRIIQLCKGRVIQQMV